MQTPRRVHPLLGLLLASGCVSVRSEGRLWISTDPPGAVVWIDGKDTGFATPTTIPLGMGGAPAVTLRREGYREESFTVGSGTVYEGWMLGSARSGRYLDAPLFYYLTVDDFLFPFRFLTRRTPGRVHLKLLPL